MLSSHLLFCLPLLLAPFTVPCRIVFAMPELIAVNPIFKKIVRYRIQARHIGICSLKLSFEELYVCHRGYFIIKMATCICKICKTNTKLKPWFIAVFFFFFVYFNVCLWHLLEYKNVLCQFFICRICFIN